MKKINPYFFPQPLFKIAVILVVISAGYFSFAYGEEIRYDQGGRRDPFTPLIGEGAVAAVGNQSHARADVKIQGIIIDSQQGSMVLIDGEFYKEGDRIGDMNLISIYKDRIILSQEDVQKTIWLREEIADQSNPTAGGNENKPA